MRIPKVIQLNINAKVLKERGRSQNCSKIALNAGDLVTFRTKGQVGRSIDDVTQLQSLGVASTFTWERLDVNNPEKGLPRLLALMRLPYELEYSTLRVVLAWWLVIQRRRQHSRIVDRRIEALTLNRYLDLPWKEVPFRVRLLSFLAAFIHRDRVAMIFIPGNDMAAKDWLTIEQSLSHLARISMSRFIIVREDAEVSSYPEFYLDLRTIRTDTRTKIKVFNDEEDDDDAAA